MLAIVTGLVLVSALLALVAAFHPRIARSREGRSLAFVALAVLPALCMWAGFTEHLDRATSTRFCLSCHVMHDFGETLRYDDRSYIPAVHYQSNLIPRDHACYTCHSDYALFGGVKTKLHGLRHVYVEYFGTIPKPTDIKLYNPFPNLTCLHCHLGSRKFEEVNGHHKTPDMLSQVKSGQLSCISSGCHDTVHDVSDLQGAALWKEPK